MRRMQANLLLISSLLLPAWWLATGILLYNTGDFASALLSGGWIPINVVGLIACILFSVGMPVLLRANEANVPTPGAESQSLDSSIVLSKWIGGLGRWGLLLSQTGIILFASIQYYETFLWPVAAKYDKKLIESGGPLVFGNAIVAIPLLLSGLILAVGFLLILLYLRKSQAEKLWPWILFSGALLFGSGLIAPVRTLGMVLLAVALFRYGLRRRNE